MSDEMEFEVNFARQVDVEVNGKASAGITVRYSVPLSSSTDDAIEAAREQYREIKALIFTELGLAFNQDPVTKTVVEIFPGAAPVAAPPQPIPAPPATMPTVVDQSLATAASPAQQAAANHLGNHVVPPSGEPDLQTGQPGVPLPPPEELNDWVDQCWYMLLTEPDAWIDLRSALKSTDAPDFKAVSHERFPEKGVLGSPRPQTLYLHSKFGPPPAWAVANLHLVEAGINKPT